MHNKYDIAYRNSLACARVGNITQTLCLSGALRLVRRGAALLHTQLDMCVNVGRVLCVCVLCACLLQDASMVADAGSPSSLGARYEVAAAGSVGPGGAGRRRAGFDCGFRACL